MDEAIVRALGNGGEKPERLALEPGFYRLAMRAIDMNWPPAPTSTTATCIWKNPRAKRNARASDVSRKLQFHQPDEAISARTLSPTAAFRLPNKSHPPSEMLRLVEIALRGTHRTAREPSILQAIEGFTEEEIAAITDRKPDEIRASVKAACEHLESLRCSPLRRSSIPIARSNTA